MHAAQHHLLECCCMPKQRRSSSMPTMQRENRGPTHWQNSEACTKDPLDNPHAAKPTSFVIKPRRCMEADTLSGPWAPPHHGIWYFMHHKLSEIAAARKAAWSKG